MISTSDWIRNAGLRVLIAAGVLLVYLLYLGMVAFLMRPTLKALGPLL